MKISAIIPTRGDVSMSRIVDHLMSYPEIKEVVIVKGDTPFNRYLAATRAANHIIYTQDDDCVTDVGPLIEAYREPGLVGTIANAMTPEHAAQYPGRQTLLGFGAIFDACMVTCLAESAWERDALFLRESDRIFATIHPHVTVFPRIEILPHAYADNRLWKQPDHVASRVAMERRIFEKTGIQA